MNPIRNLTKNLIVLGVSLLLMVLFLEIAIRIFIPQVTYSTARHSSPQIFQESDYLPWTLLPGATDTHIGVYGDFNVSVKINSLGIRDYERPIGENLTRILVMGDSMTYGFGAEMGDTYAKSLERLLNSKGTNYQTFNTGFANGYSLDSYYLYLKNFGLETFKPDAIIIGFFVYNDITDLSLNTWETDEAGLPVKITSPYYSIDDSHRLRSAKRTFPLLKNKFINTIYESLLTRSHLFVLIKTQIAQRQTISSANRIFDRTYNPQIAADWEKNKMLLDAINKLAKEHDAKLMLVALPVRFQVRDAEWSLYEGQIGKDMVSRTRPNDELSEYAQKNNITFIDVLAGFREEDSITSLFLPIDGHFNAQGHALVAKTIYSDARKDFESIRKDK